MPTLAFKAHPIGNRLASVVRCADGGNMGPKDPSSRDTAPGYLAGMIAHAAVRRIDARLREHGATMSQMQPLLILAYNGPMPQRDILAYSTIGQPGMTALIAKLERNGLIERVPHPTDRRASLLSVTAAGLGLVDRASPIIYAVNEEATLGLLP